MTLKEQKRLTIKNSNDQQTTSSSSFKIRSRNTFNKKNPFVYLCKMGSIISQHKKVSISQGLFWTFIGCDYRTQSSAMSFKKNIFIRNG